MKKKEKKIICLVDHGSLIRYYDSLFYCFITLWLFKVIVMFLFISDTKHRLWFIGGGCVVITSIRQP